MNPGAAAPDSPSVARWSAIGYTGVSFALAAAFYATASLVGSYTEVAKVGGAVWVFLLSMIVSMPLMTSVIRARIITTKGEVSE